MIIYEIYIPNHKLHVRANVIKFTDKSDTTSKLKTVNVNTIFEHFGSIFGIQNTYISL